MADHIAGRLATCRAARRHGRHGHRKSQGPSHLRGVKRGQAARCYGRRCCCRSCGWLTARRRRTATQTPFAGVPGTSRHRVLRSAAGGGRHYHARNAPAIAEPEIVAGCPTLPPHTASPSPPPCPQRSLSPPSRLRRAHARAATRFVSEGPSAFKAASAAGTPTAATTATTTRHVTLPAASASAAPTARWLRRTARWDRAPFGPCRHTRPRTPPLLAQLLPCTAHRCRCPSEERRSLPLVCPRLDARLASTPVLRDFGSCAAGPSTARLVARARGGFAVGALRWGSCGGGYAVGLGMHGAACMVRVWWACGARVVCVAGRAKGCGDGGLFLCRWVAARARGRSFVPFRDTRPH